MRRVDLHFIRRLDWSGIFAVVLLIAVGIAFLFSAGFRGDDRPIMGYYERQLGWAAIGCVLFLVFARLDYRIWIRWAWLIYLLALALLLLVCVPGFGVRMFGARRWIELSGIRMQPSEVMKLALILALAGLFGNPGRDLRKARYVVGALILTALPMAAIMEQPDLGTAMIFPPIAMAAMFAAGVPGRYLARLAGMGLLLAAVLAGFLVVPHMMGVDAATQDRLSAMVGVEGYQRDRILVFLDSSLDPLGAGWNKAQSRIAIGSGRMWGKGYLNGQQNLLGFLPRTVAPTDFIYAVIGEEAGFAGSLAILFLFSILLLSLLRTAGNAPDRHGAVLCAGVAAMLFCHVFINIAMTAGLMPITGVPLPLVSYGGTFMVGIMSALGMAQSVHVRKIRSENFQP